VSQHPAMSIDVLGVDTHLRYMTPAERMREYRQAVAPYEAQLAMIYAHTVRPIIVRPINETVGEFRRFELVEVGPLPDWAQQAETMLIEAIGHIRRMYLTGI